MKNIKTLALYTAVVLMAIFAVGVIAYAYAGVSPKVVVEGDYIEAASPEVALGSGSGADKYFPQRFHQGLFDGGSVYATTSGATAIALTMESAMINESRKVIELTPTVSYTLTTIASTSMDWLGYNAGDYKEIMLVNASSTAASTVTIAAGTGVDLQYAEATGGDLVLNGLDYAKLTFMRKSNTDVLLIFEEYTEAD